MNIDNKFAKQIAYRKNYQWKTKLGMKKDQYIAQDIATQSFEKGFLDAYERKGTTFRDTGLAYRINPGTGEKEMFVAGSQGTVDWIFNLSNAVSYGTEKYLGKYLDQLWPLSYRNKYGFRRPRLDSINRDRYRQQKGISRMARKHRVENMYGHSRGGALVADTEFSGGKYGLDAAMILAKKPNITNFRRPGIFDAALGLSGEDNRIVTSGHSIHWAYGS